MRGGILDVKGADPLDEGLHPPLLKNAHQGRLEGLGGIGGDLGHSGLGPSALLHEAPRNLLELEIPSHVGRNEDVGELARRHEELGDEVDVPVVGAAVFLPWLLSLLEVAVLLEELCRGRLLVGLVENMP